MLMKGPVFSMNTVMGFGPVDDVRFFGEFHKALL